MAPTLEQFLQGHPALDEVAKYVHARATAVPKTFLHVAPLEDLLRRCEALEAQPVGSRGVLWGQFFAVKDNIDVAGQPTTAACPAFKRTPMASAVAVAALLAQGAVCVGKTNMDQFAAGLNGTRSPYGVPENAVDSRVVPGGSSSGSASAVASGVVAFALGTDTAGSGRVPAGFQGIVGIKPTVGLISIEGVVPACASLDCVSVFCKDLTLGCRVTKVMAEYTREYQQSAGTAPASAQAQRSPITLPRVVAGMRCFHYAAVDEPIIDFQGPRGAAYAEKAICGYADALQRVNEVGGCADAFDFSPFMATAKLLYGTALVQERYTGIQEFLESRPDLPRSEAGVVDVSQDDRLLPVTRAIIAGGANYSKGDVESAHAVLAQHTAQCWAEWDSKPAQVLAFPTVTHHYTVTELAAQEASDPPMWPYNSHLGLYTNFVNLLGLCAISVPYGEFTTPGGEGEAPLRCATGITLVGPAGADSMLWQIAANMLDPDYMRF